MIKITRAVEYAPVMQMMKFFESGQVGVSSNGNGLLLLRIAGERAIDLQDGEEFDASELTALYEQVDIEIIIKRRT